MQYLAGTDSVHTTAAICDYLDDRATADDEVAVVSVAPPATPATARDREEALNVAPVRLATIGSVETDLRESDEEPALELLAAADEVAADEIVIGAYSGNPAATAELGATAQTLLTAASCPVVVVPIPEL